MKKILFSGAVLSLILMSCSSTKVATKADLGTYINTITAPELSKHLYIVAGDEMQGRNTGEEGQKKAGKYLIEEYKKMGISYPEAASDWYQKVPSEFMKRGFAPKLNDSENIWAFIKGSEKPEEIIVISAHYDHVGMKNGEIYNGADDDGSGTCAVLEIAEAFAKAKAAGNSPRRSILFMTVTGEEKGLLGSDYYSSHPAIPLENTVADLNIDMIGRNDIGHEKDTNYIYIIGSNMLSDELHEVNEKANETYTRVKLDYKFNSLSDPNQFYYRSDHYNFAKHNIPSIFYFSGVHEDYHQPTDDVEKIIFPKVEKVAKLVFFTAWELADRSSRITLNR